jgi:hypothetical protein
MITIIAHKAHDIGNINIVDSCTIVIGNPPIPEFKTLDEAEEKYKDDASRIAWALTHSLPGGTLHQLTIQLLEHKTNLLRIPDVK